MKVALKADNQRYRLGYHLMPAGGWINDPNGFSWFNGYYHIFYQYYPYAAEWGPMHWGHARSKDMLHWETLPTALCPDENEDGCFSGSAVEFEGKLWLIYTGHHCLSDDPEDFYQDQRIAYSEDGITFHKYEGNPVIKTPAENTKHFRDPKVWREGDSFFMVLGSQDKNGLGRALLYRSKNLKEWDFVSVLASSTDKETEGYMWECPDFFNLDGKDVLLMSPQGLAAKGDLYKNLNQTGYMMGELNRDDYRLNRGGFREIDNGHDFYATQTLLTPDGRRVMFAWMNAWDSAMPEKEDKWAGALILPRELRIKDGRIFQSPIRETESLRQREIATSNSPATSLPTTAEIILEFNEPQKKDSPLVTIGDGKQNLSLSLDGNRLALVRTTKDGERAATLTQGYSLKLQIFIDRSSAEIFVNDGEATFTERMYWSQDLSLTTVADKVKIYELEKETNRYYTTLR